MQLSPVLEFSVGGPFIATYLSHIPNPAFIRNKVGISIPICLSILPISQRVQAHGYAALFSGSLLSVPQMARGWGHSSLQLHDCDAIIPWAQQLSPGLSRNIGGNISAFRKLGETRLV